LRQALDTTGALLGPLVAIALMHALNGEIRSVFWLAVLPAIVAVALLAFGVQEPEHHGVKQTARSLPQWRDLRKLPSAFWIVVTLGAVVTLARFSEAFLVLRALDVGLSRDWTPLALVVMNATYVASAYPAGWWSDRIAESNSENSTASSGENRLRARIWLLLLGLLALIVADVVLAFGGSVVVNLCGVALWGLHMGLTQCVFAAMVADTAPAELRGSAFGVFNFICGIVAIASSLIAGALWEWRGPWLTFLIGAVFAAMALAGSMCWRARYRPTPRKNGA
jgi:predicted MFS family arabinose efflux permease